jgi:hypothetical protein
MIPHEGSGRKAMSGLVTIGDLIREEKLLWVYCSYCGQERDVDLKSLTSPGDTPVPGHCWRFLKCSTRWSKKIDIRLMLFRDFRGAYNKIWHS